MSDRLEFTITTISGRFDEHDETWADQEADLFASLRSDVDELRVETTAMPGSKGPVEAVIIALGSAGAFTAAVDCFRAWLARDKTRRIELAWTDNGRDEKISLTATEIDSAGFERLAEAVQTRLSR